MYIFYHIYVDMNYITYVTNRNLETKKQKQKNPPPKKRLGLELSQ